MRTFICASLLILGTALAGFSADAPATPEQCAEIERQLADIDQLMKASNINLEKLGSALTAVQDASKIYKDQYDMLKLLLDQSGTLRSRVNILTEIALNRAAFAANEQAIGGLFSSTASVRSQLSQKAKDYADKQKEYLTKCRPAAAP